MALLQMPEYNDDSSLNKELNDRIAELESQLNMTRAQLAEACEERDLVENKVREAVKMVDQRDASIRRIEQQVKQLHEMAMILQRENAEYKAANEQLVQSLTDKQNDLEAVQQEFAGSVSHGQVVEKINAMEATLSEMLTELKEEEKAGFDVVSKKISIISDAGFQMKVLSTLNTVDQNTSRLRNYNDSKCLAEIDRLGRKIDHIDKLVNDNRFIGLLCIGSVGIGIMLAKLLL